MLFLAVTILLLGIEFVIKQKKRVCFYIPSFCIFCLAQYRNGRLDDMYDWMRSVTKKEERNIW